jgi:pyrroline-5-carboxylate reductase
MARIAIIGGGNMGEALLAGLIRAGRPARELVVSEKVPERADYQAQNYAVRVAPMAEAVENAAFVIVAVKPADAESVVVAIATAASRAESDAVEQVLVSVVAGVTAAFYEAHLPAGYPVIRVMPNAPALVGAGITALARGRFATSAQLSEAAELLSGVGGVLTVAEAQIDAVAQAVKEEFGGLDCLVHGVAFAKRDEREIR